MGLIIRANAMVWYIYVFYFKCHKWNDKNVT